MLKFPQKKEKVDKSNLSLLSHVQTTAPFL